MLLCSDVFLYGLSCCQTCCLFNRGMDDKHFHVIHRRSEMSVLTSSLKGQVKEVHISKFGTTTHTVAEDLQWE